MSQDHVSDEAVRDAAERFRKAIEETDKSTLPIALKEFPYGSSGDVVPLLGTFLIESGLGEFDYVSGQRERGSIADNTWHTHAWLQRDSLVVDIAADQYRDAISPVMVTRDSPWHAQFNGEVDHVADYRLYDEFTKRTLGDAYRTIVGRLTSLRRHGSAS